MTSIVDSDLPAPGSGIRSDGRGRMLIGHAQREALLDEFERSGLSGTAFCRLHGLTYPTFATLPTLEAFRPAGIKPAERWAKTAFRSGKCRLIRQVR